jgi:predicted Zn-dependent protease
MMLLRTLAALVAALTVGISDSDAAATSAVLSAMKAELDRTMTGLAKEPTAPYYLAYGVTDITSTRLVATFGELETDNTQSKRVLDIDLRVGSHALDNTHSIRGVAFEMGRGSRGISLPLSNDIEALRSVIWLATDRAYKSASERYEKVVTNQKVKVRDEDTSADMSVEKPYNFIEEPTPLQFDVDTWRQNIRTISAVFKGQPGMYEGKVSVQADRVIKYLVNSEGSIIQSYEPIIKLYIMVKTKADDGMSLPLYESYSAYSQDRLPSVEKLLADAKTLVSLCQKLRQAPMMETFSGPAILSGRSAGVFFHEIFGHRVEGHRQKDANSSQTFKAFLNQPVLPSFINVVFDPTIKSYRGQDVVGAYKFDDEGIPGQRVVAVDHGVFRNFLMSRSPIEKFPRSNGHGRREAGYRSVSRQSNLIVEAEQSVSPDSLRGLLRAECKKQGKEFGLYFDNIQGGFTFTGRTIPNAFNVLPLIVYKIYADGRPDELVRGVDLIGTPLTTFNNIVAASSDIGIFNGVCGAESGGVPVSASSPELFVSTIEVQKKEKSQAKLPILDDPDGQYISTADRNVLMNTMEEELQRNMQNIALSDLARPYNIEYTLQFRRRNGVQAVLGAVEEIDTARMAMLTVKVRVGSSKFDNTNFFDVALGFFGSSDDEETFRSRHIPYDVPIGLLKRELWLATDACYKEAVEAYTKKLATLKNKTRSDTTWDYQLMRADSATDLRAAVYATSIDKLIDIAKPVSAVFRDAKSVHGSRVSIEFVPVETMFVNSEGRRYHKIDCFTGVEIIATTQAADGMPLSEMYSAYSIDPKDLPGVDSLKRATNGLIKNLDKVASAPTIEAYSGPVLFEGQAATQIFAQVFARNCVAQRQVASEGGFRTNDKNMVFQNKIGARVLPEFLSVYAIPSMEESNGTPVAGHYRIDDDGILAQDVKLVDKGYLRTLLSSRVPTKRIKASNGHQRGGGAMLSVVELRNEDAERSLTPMQLRERLLKLVKDRDLPYGIIVRKVTDMNIFSTGIYELSIGEMQGFSGDGTTDLLETVRIFPDGTEEVIRGVQGAGFAPAVFKDIVATGRSKTVMNYLAPTVTPSFLSGGSLYEIATIISPDILFEDVEIRPEEGDYPHPPLLAKP